MVPNSDQASLHLAIERCEHESTQMRPSHEPDSLMCRQRLSESGVMIFPPLRDDHAVHFQTLFQDMRPHQPFHVLQVNDKILCYPLSS